ncbi:MAG: hypothetical protein E7598_01835 [Ruminococcaceae bacterium]|nr:hypothetical protein [Oscillospiraceae bacterium]
MQLSFPYIDKKGFLSEAFLSLLF